MFKPEEARERYWRQVRELADKHEVPVSEARTLWPRFYKKGGVKKLLLWLTTKASPSVTICPYCRDDLPVFHDHVDACYQCGTFDHPEPEGYECAPESVWDCPSCSTKMHEDCYQELGACTTLGCAHRRPPQATATPQVTATPRVVGRPAERTEDPSTMGTLAVFSLVIGMGVLASLIVFSLVMLIS